MQRYERLILASGVGVKGLTARVSDAERVILLICLKFGNFENFEKLYIFDKSYKKKLYIFEHELYISKFEDFLKIQKSYIYSMYMNIVILKT